MNATRIRTQITLTDFQETLLKFKNNIKLNSHAQERITEHQRNVFKGETLIFIFENKTPAFIGIQYNGRYSAFFRTKNSYLRIIFKIEKESIQIITFTIEKSIPQLPK